MKTAFWFGVATGVAWLWFAAAQLVQRALQDRREREKNR